MVGNGTVGSWVYKEKDEGSEESEETDTILKVKGTENFENHYLESTPTYEGMYSWPDWLEKKVYNKKIVDNVVSFDEATPNPYSPLCSL